MSLLENLLKLSLEAAPWLVLGLVLGGLIKTLIPNSFLQRHLSGGGIGSILKATIIGAPLPLCSCGVIPAAMGLRKAGASKPATAAFLVATPETGVDSISVTYALLGPLMAIIRPTAALFSAITAGLLVAIFDREDSILPDTGQINSCCPGSNKNPDSGCISHQPCTEQTGFNKVWRGIQTTFTELLDDIGLWLLAGLLFAAAAETYLPTDFLSNWGQGFTAMMIMLLAGIPMYICATSSTPIAAGLVLAGVSPGVALVLLLTGPATNLSTLGVISKSLGRRSMWLYLTGVASTAIIAGWLVDTLFNIYDINIQAQIQSTHGIVPPWLAGAALLLLLTVALRQIVKLGTVSV